MGNVKPRKFLEDGVTLNPKWKPRKSGPSGKSGKSGKPMAHKGFRTAEFIAWDGEGITDPVDTVTILQLEQQRRDLEAEIFTSPHSKRTNIGKAQRAKLADINRQLDRTATGRHRYVLLMASTGQRCISGSGITTLDALETICAVAWEHPGKVHVMFGGSYDANMILGDLTRDQVAHVWGGGHVTVGNYDVSYTPRRCLTIREWDEPRFSVDSKGKWAPRFRTRVIIWDVWGFFQGTFIDAVSQWLGADHPSLATIIAGKARRSQFVFSEMLTEIVPYTTLEVAALVQLMTELRDRLWAAGLTVTRWDGAGAVASALLKREGIKDHLPAENERDYTSAREQAFARAYAGGRMEVCKYGRYNGPVYHYDINSAYPAAMLTLPSLRRGRWVHNMRGDLRGTFTVHEGIFDQDGKLKGRDKYNTPGMMEALHPLFYREILGSIIYPTDCWGWWWQPEVDAMRDCANPYHTFTTKSTWTWVPDTDERPFSFLPALYDDRRARKARGDRSEKAIKLGINSCYGKLAQSAGWREGRALPPYHCLEWAGYITSHTRATLYRAAMQAHDKIIMLATDGIYSTAPLDLPTGDNLGQWEAHVHDEIVVAQSGVYWCRDGEHWSEFLRGFDKDSLSREAVLRAWSDGQSHYSARSTRFVGMGSALAGGDLFDHWRRWRSVPKIVRLDPTGGKRYLPVQYTKEWPHEKLITTYPALNDCESDYPWPSTPYPLPWYPAAGEWNTTLHDGVDERITEQERSELECEA